MRHFEWLSERIVALGGRPTLEREEILKEGAMPRLIAHDLEGEEQAIARYRLHQKLIGEEELVRLLERIISDEEAHREALSEILHELETSTESGASEKEAESAEVNSSLSEELARLNRGVRHEYTVILDYLYHAFTAAGCEEKEELLKVAVDEMKHLGWLAEKVEELGGRPEIDTEGEIPRTGLEEMLRRSLVTEERVIAEYAEDSRVLPEPSLRQMLERIRGHEVYHQYLLAHLLAELAERRQPAWTVGSLLGEPQEQKR